VALSLNKPKLDNLAGDIWKSAERLRGKFKAYEYQSVILPIIVIRRLECVLVAWREAKRAEVLATSGPAISRLHRLARQFLKTRTHSGIIGST
jgi:type I restriction-modification system DNA methylase subunit